MDSEMVNISVMFKCDDDAKILAVKKAITEATKDLEDRHIMLNTRTAKPDNK